MGAQSKVSFAGVRQRIPAATARALNRSIGSAKTALARRIAQETGLKVGSVNARLRISKASEERLSARIYASVKGVPLALFRPKGRYPSRGKGTGVSASIGGRSVSHPHAFIAKVGTKKLRGVFEREGKARGPLDTVFGPSIADLSEKHTANALARGQEQVVKNLQSEFRFALSRTA